MDTTSNCFKVIGFDLDTIALRTYYPYANWRKAYEDIKSYMIKKNFIWQQGSIYISQNPINNREAKLIVKDLICKNPWLNLCMRDCILADITKKHNLNYLFDKSFDLKPEKMPKVNFSR